MQVTTQTSAQPITENHQGFNGENHWFLSRFANRWAYREQTPLGLIEAGTDQYGAYWAGRENVDHCITPAVDDHVSLINALEDLAGDLAKLGHRWQPPVDALIELMGDD